jgi:pyruvate dehydrogenase E1 component alpha subunit
MMTDEELIAFEADIAERFNRGEIRAPIHLHGGCEAQLIKVFETIDRADWICSNWRSHYHALLHGIPPDLVRAEIMAGRSMTLCFPVYRMISSAIVGGILPIALGIAFEIKRSGGTNRVWVFCGDMTARGGMFHECLSYAAGHDLPIHFVCEDNGKSVCSDTEETWGPRIANPEDDFVTTFVYSSPWPHAGSGKRIQF